MTQDANLWQSQVLTDAELAKVLAGQSSLEAMATLQRQLELRAGERGDVSRVVDEDFVVTEAQSIIESPEETAQLESVQEPVTAPAAEPATAAEPEPEPAPVLEQAPAPAAAPNIAEALNQLFANRQHVTFEPQTPIEISSTSQVFASPANDPYPPTEPGFLSAKGYAPEPVSSDTTSIFIPTFENPVPPEGFTGTVQSAGFVEDQPQEVAEKITHEEAQVGAAVAAVLTAIDDSNSGLVAEASGTEVGEGETPTAEQPVTGASQPYSSDESTDSAQDADSRAFAAEAALLPSAEEAVTAFEENFVTESQPTLVDEVIESVSSAVANAPMAPEPVIVEEATESSNLNSARDLGSTSPVASNENNLAVSGFRSARSLLATWNGNGILLLLAATGFMAASNRASLLTTISGAFVALAISGFGFGAAALAARRGRQPQAVLSRAVFGVNGAALPLAVVILARLAATATIALLASQAIYFFFGVPSTLPIKIGSYQVSTSILIVVVLLIIGAITASFSTKIRYLLAAVFAWASVAGVLLAAAAGVIVKPAAIVAGTFDFQAALGLASAIVVLIGLIWGTSAADESPDLAPTTAVPKLIAASLINFEVLGLLAIFGGYVFASLSLGVVGNCAVGVAFAVVLIVSFGNQLRRNTDAFRGFGLQRTPKWLLVLVLLVIAAAAVASSVFVSRNDIWFGFSGVLPVVGVPVLAWLAALGVDTVLRREDFHEISLARNYGFYGKVRLANLIGWLVATAVGWGFISSPVPGFGWLGYLSGMLAVSNTGLQANTGLWLAIAIGAITPIAFTIPKIRNQEAEGLALEERRRELIDVLGIVE